MSWKNTLEQPWLEWTARVLAGMSWLGFLVSPWVIASRGVLLVTVMCGLALLVLVPTALEAARELVRRTALLRARRPKSPSAETLSFSP